MSERFINELSIIISRRVEEDLIRVFSGSGRGISPDFRTIRQTIVDTLSRYMDCISMKNTISMEQMKVMDPYDMARFRAHTMEQQAAFLVRKIMESPDYFVAIEKADSWDAHRIIFREIIVLKTEKIRADSAKSNMELLREVMTGSD